MDLTLSSAEVRILGCLIEKQATTPDGYPLTLNSLVAACNQKSNREPITELDANEVMAALESLVAKDLVSTYQSARNRTAKYQHKLHQRLFDEFNFSRQELAVLCVLFLRGPQTIGEIRTRCVRIHAFTDLDKVIATLEGLEDNPHGPYVAVLPRQPGHKESRYAHLFCGEPDNFTPVTTVDQTGTGVRHLEELEAEVNTLREKLQALELRFEQFVEQFE